MNTLTIYLLTLALILIMGCQFEVNVATEKENIEALLEKYSDAWRTMDIEKFEKIFSNKYNLRIVYRRNMYIGWEYWKEHLKKTLDEVLKVNVSLKSEYIIVHPSGNVAWLSVLEDVNWTKKEESGTNQSMRVTMVLEKKKNRWLIVQAHWSFSQLDYIEELFDESENF